MSGARQNIQYSLALEPKGRGEPPVSGCEGSEPFMAKPALESPASAEHLMEEVGGRENLERAWKRVRRNKGGPGVDEMTINDAKDYLREQWPSIRSLSNDIRKCTGGATKKCTTFVVVGWRFERRKA
jgi:RNA-directed DNA polymerase